ncbi:uncharacterized protein LOC125760046 [Rhipicephalus sanguineus]|uniref:uncharacterized protein LOC125760046 n=1 Tax=Rhipicephalus sanguineus TaxID=34632 RepID=UPI0020C426E0|nr:uncharacterized protein LOC125760046 [Rhipicephalus sanguineus]
MWTQPLSTATKKDRQRACRSGRKSSSKKKPGKKNVKMRMVVSRKALTLSLNGVSTATLDPVTVQMTIDGVLVNMELDTGAAVSVMSTTQFRQLFPLAVPEPTTVKLCTYTGKLVRPQGVSSVNVQHGEHSVRLPLYVVNHKGPPLLGREWLHAVQLDWAKIWNLNNISR